jgi:hypothetical protein
MAKGKKDKRFLGNPPAEHEEEASSLPVSAERQAERLSWRHERHNQNKSAWVCEKQNKSSKKQADVRVVLLPGGLLGVVVVQVTLAETTVLLSLGGETTSLAVLVDRVADPVDASVAADGLVGRAEERRAGETVNTGCALFAVVPARQLTRQG